MDCGYYCATSGRLEGVRTASFALRFSPLHRYIVKDQFPDARKKSNTYRVPEHHVVAYPAPDDEVFLVSDQVLALWLGDDSEWSSVFYRATVAGVPDKVLLCFLYHIHGA